MRSVKVNKRGNETSNPSKYCCWEEKSWFEKPEKDAEAVASANAIDLAFVIHRNDMELKQSWAVFNQSVDQTDQEEISVGFFHIINAPAHEIDTLNTVVQRFMYVSSKLNQKYTVIIVDQALYYRLIQLKYRLCDWVNSIFPQTFLV